MTRNAATPATSVSDETEIDVTKNYQVNGTIPGTLYKALDDHRWDARIDRFPKLVARALREYAVNHGLTTDEAPAAETPADK